MKNLLLLAALTAITACSSSSSTTGDPNGQGGDPNGSPNNGTAPPPVTSAPSFGEEFTGLYHLGPVEYSGKIPNACTDGVALPEVQKAYGAYIAGVANERAGGGAACNACILIKTQKGKSLVARLVTYGDESGSGGPNTANNIDISPAAYDALFSGEEPRLMTWQFARCPGTDPIFLEVRSGSNPWWVGFWVRNGALPVKDVEVQVDGEPAFHAATREGGNGAFDVSPNQKPFTLRITGSDGQKLTYKVTDTSKIHDLSKNLVIPTNVQFQ